MNEKAKEPYGYWKEHYKYTLTNGDIDYLFSLLSEREKEIKSLTSELNKRLSPHENSNLEEMKIQSEQHSLAAKQAYINALEWTVKWREEKIKDLKQGIGEVLDGTLPYLAEQRLKKLIEKGEGK